MIIREPAVAGSFYEVNKENLKKQINYCINHKLGPKTITRENFIAAIVPHAGYEYSGPVAAWIYAKIPKANYILIGTNHSGLGARFSLMKSGMWKTPLGGVLIDENFSNKLLKACKVLEYDVLAHQEEHSIEVQLPFLQFRFGDNFKFVPICILNEFADDTLLDACKHIGNAIAEIIKTEKEKWIILATTDFSHYIPQELAEETDNYIMGGIMKLNEKEFFSRIVERNASVCGYGAVAVAIAAAKKLNAKKVNVLKYATSGDISLNYSSVVGYASIVMY